MNGWNPQNSIAIIHTIVRHGKKRQPKKQFKPFQINANPNTPAKTPQIENDVIILDISALLVPVWEAVAEAMAEVISPSKPPSVLVDVVTEGTGVEVIIAWDVITDVDLIAEEVVPLPLADPAATYSQVSREFS